MVATPDLTKDDPTANQAAVPPPVKRRPGRPRKNPLPPAEVTPDAVAAEVVGAVDVAAVAPHQQKAPADDRIGDEVDPRAEAIGFDDGRTYRCADGKIVERLT